jgi:hypothetical protein
MSGLVTPTSPTCGCPNPAGPTADPEQRAEHGDLSGCPTRENEDQVGRITLSI